MVWNITRNLAKKILKVDQLLFIGDLLEEENLTNYNAFNIFIKASFLIGMLKPHDCKAVNLIIYQQLVSKFMYLACGIRLDIVFTVRRLSKYNINPCKDHF